MWKVSVPADSQATELLKKSFPETQEKIAHSNPKFSYSSFERDNRFFYVKGTKIGDLHIEWKYLNSVKSQITLAKALDKFGNEKYQGK